MPGIPAASIYRWPQLPRSTLRVRSVGSTVVWGFRGRTNAPPVLSNILPPPGSIIARASAVQLDLTDDGAIVRYHIAATFSGHPSVREVVHDGEGFAPRYASSTKTPILKGGMPVGLRFLIRRTGDWLASPTLHIEAVDDGGNVSVLL